MGRITAIFDVFDALTSERPYKKAWSIEETVDFMKNESGKHFDPELIPLFLDILPEILKIKNQFAESAVWKLLRLFEVPASKLIATLLISLVKSFVSFFNYYFCGGCLDGGTRKNS